MACTSVHTYMYSFPIPPLPFHFTAVLKKKNNKHLDDKTLRSSELLSAYFIEVPTKLHIETTNSRITQRRNPTGVSNLSIIRSLQQSSNIDNLTRRITEKQRKLLESYTTSLMLKLELRPYKDTKLIHFECFRNEFFFLVVRRDSLILNPLNTVGSEHKLLKTYKIDISFKIAESFFILLGTVTMGNVANPI